MLESTNHHVNSRLIQLGMLFKTSAVNKNLLPYTNIVKINSAIKQLKQLIELNLTGSNYFSLGYIFNRYIIKQHFYLCKCAYGLNSTLYSVNDKCRSLSPLIFLWGKQHLFSEVPISQKAFLYSPMKGIKMETQVSLPPTN